MDTFSPARFPAPVVRSRTFGELVLSETRYAPDAMLAAHAHEYACLVVVLDGTFCERIGARERVGEPGMVIVRPEGEPHSDAFGKRGAICLNVELSPAWVAQLREGGPASSAAFSFAGRQLHAELLDPDDLSSTAVESLVLELLASRSATGVATPHWLLRARELMHDEFATRLTLQRIAAAAGVHPIHLAATFRRIVGVPVAAYIRQLRLEYACRELIATPASLTDIAYAAGFADQSHFCRLFRQFVGMTPRAYRAAMQRP
ncbi:MAG: AraC family transcriptional regulator [Thermoanaerobaculia bacterium]